MPLFAESLRRNDCRVVLWRENLVSPRWNTLQQLSQVRKAGCSAVASLPEMILVSNSFLSRLLLP